MALNPIVPRLRVVNGTNDIARAEIRVPAGDEIEVSETVAAQLGPAFRPVEPVDPEPRKRVKKTDAS